MAIVFHSYANQDRGRVRPLIQWLADQGCRVWWDESIDPGGFFERTIEHLRAYKRRFVASAVERFGTDDQVELHETPGADQSRLDRK